MERPGSVFRDALTGLLNLGYEEDRASLVLKDIFAGEPDLDVAGLCAPRSRLWPRGSP